MIEYADLKNVPRRPPIGVAVDDSANLTMLFPDCPLLGQRWKHVIIFRNADWFYTNYEESQEFVQQLRTKVEPGGSWIEFK